MIKVHKVTKSYVKGKVKAVENLSFNVHKGEIFGFIGPNGAGKTTTIKLLTGILAPDSGDIEIGGVNIVDNPVEAKRLIGYVPDQHDIYDRITGIEYLNFMCDIYAVPNDVRRARIDRYLDMFSITSAAGELIKSYSHGMRQKLMLTGALVHNPALWLLDEPMVGLDPLAALRLKEEMREHVKAGNTVFFSTHVLEVAERLCDRIGIIKDGKLVASGTLDELRTSVRTGDNQTLEALFFEITDQSGDTPHNFEV